MKNKINIIDNFLPKEEFLKLNTILMSDMMPWFFNDYKVFDTKKEDLNNYQFVHIILNQIFIQILQELNVLLLFFILIQITDLQNLKTVKK